MDPKSLVVMTDIHSNHEAFLAAVADAKKEAPGAPFVCLGDLVGYGPQPIECLELAMSLFLWVILGNHDSALMFDPDDNFNEEAWASVKLARDLAEKLGKRGDAIFEFQSAMKKRHAMNGVGFVHGSPRNPTFEYVKPEHVYEAERMAKIAAAMTNPVTLFGHTHHAGIVGNVGAVGGTPTWTEAAELNGAPFEVPAGQLTLLNPGSVGQPRDGDWRASYGILTFGPPVTFRWRRVEYDVDKTIAAYSRLSVKLNPWFANRLKKGA